MIMMSVIFGLFQIQQLSLMGKLSVLKPVAEGNSVHRVQEDWPKPTRTG